MIIYGQKIEDTAMGGCILVVVFCLALILANSPLGVFYEKIVEASIHIGIENHSITKPALLWVNEGLMAIFFMLLSLEIKYNFFFKKSMNKKELIAPIMAAVGGILFPIIIYCSLNYNNTLALHGWGIAMTTDTAMALAVIALLGDRVPRSLRLFMLMLSVVDDVFAIIVIALFYTSTLSWIAILLSIIGFFVLLILNLMRVFSLTPYILIGVFIWFCVVQSGIHATLAGVFIGFIIPIAKGRKQINLKKLEKYLKTWVIYFVLPTFIFMNGGISFSHFMLKDIFSNLSLGIILGLFLGKPIGSFLFLLIALLTKCGKLPKRANIKQMIALCFLSGIGFTMSLFLAALAFNNTIYEDLSGQSIVLGSVLSLITGTTLFLMFNNKKS